MKIAIIIPSRDIVHTDFAMCLTKLVTRTCGAGIFPMLINPRSSLIQKGRYDGVNQALEHGADKILFIDSDQTFPDDALIRLINHNLPFVGATCRLRQESVEYSARGLDHTRIDFKHRSGLHQVTSNGFPFCLIDADVFGAIGRPWFNVSMIDGKWISEDESFCHDAAAAGYDIWVDADLTKEIGHIGTKIYI